jgi:PPK2 family polyphosphate:nucleotide phosphotransferase
MAKQRKAQDRSGRPTARVSDLLRLPPGPVDLDAVDARATPGFDGGKGEAAAALQTLAPRLADLQERLFAEGRTGGTRRVLLVLQGMDTSGKGGTVRHVVGQVDPQGVSIASFKAPTKEELAHDFLWRIRRRLPGPGMLGVFDRSHYEDVVVARVLGLVPRRTWSRRFDSINRFEESLVADGVVVVKCFLHISREESKARLLQRLERADKRWKFNPADIDARGQWESMMTAYAEAFERCNTESAPWLVVPADRKWYRNWAVMNVLVEQLQAMALTWPEPDFDVEEQRRRLLASD